MIWAVVGEIVLIATILTLYVFSAFTWSDLGQDFEDVVDNMNNPAGFIVGEAMWAVEGCVFLICGSIFRLEAWRGWDFLLSSLCHVLYHAIRWPIFAGFMVASLTHESRTHQGVNVTVIQVNSSIAQVAVWFDFIVAGIVGLAALVYASLAHCKTK
jgi:hypothetical protein